MPGLAEVVRGLAARDGVDAVVLVSPDGLPIDHAARGACDADALSALATTVLRPAARIGESAARGPLGRVVFEYAGGLALLSVLGDGNALLVLLAPDADAGTMLFDLGRMTPALASLL
jgi:predicted regulator of Ras-like GTPase activity (Roadblock/LC7/MglB family)